MAPHGRDCVGGDRILPPEIGWADELVKNALSGVMRATTSPTLVVGLYTGGHGAVSARWTTDELTIVEVDEFEFAFGAWDPQAFLDRWLLPESGERYFDPPDVSFIWPTDRSWFFRADPDSSFVTFSGPAAAGERVVEGGTTEVWVAQSAGPWGPRTIPTVPPPESR